MKNKIVIVVSKFNKLITDELLAGVLEELNNQSVNEKNVQTIEVPGALEIPGTIKMILHCSNKFKCLFSNTNPITMGTIKEIMLLNMLPIPNNVAAKFGDKSI